MIVERSKENSNFPTVYAMNTFFYPKLLQSGECLNFSIILTYFDKDNRTQGLTLF